MNAANIQFVASYINDIHHNVGTSLRFLKCRKNLYEGAFNRNYGIHILLIKIEKLFLK